MVRPRAWVNLLIIVLGALLAGAASAAIPGATPMDAAPAAQRGPDIAPGTPAVLRLIDLDFFTAVPAPAGFRAGVSAQTATINVTYSPGFPPQAQTAFQFAAGIWQTQITSSVPIQINANWTALPSGVLGSAGPTFFARSFTNAPISGTWYPIALANKLAGSDLVAGSAHINASFSSGVNWNFETDGIGRAGMVDFASVVLHEIGHGLGFTGSMTVSGGMGSWGFGGPPTYPDCPCPIIYDRFTGNSIGQSLLDPVLFPNPSAALSQQLTSNNIFFEGANAMAANGGTRPKLYAPSMWQQGSSYVHLDEGAYPAGTPNSLMTPFFGNAEVNYSPGPIALGILQDLGWGISTPPPSFTLTVSKAGSGAGTVTSASPAQPVIDCGVTCSASYPSGTVVTLTATAAAGSQFTGWSGACAGSGNCNVTMNAAQLVTATFALIPSFTLTVSKTGSGSGTVTSTAPPSPSINCGATCSAAYPSGTLVSLTATPSADSTFAGWSGACGGTGTCTVTMDAAKSVTATFNLSPPPPASFTLTVTKTGTGTGAVVSTSPPSPTINCGGTCAAAYVDGTVVTLAASADPGSTFAGWSGACTGTGGCSVTMDAAKSVTAAFDLSAPPMSFTLTVSKLGTGAGTVTSTDPASPVITCGVICSASYPSGTLVTLVSAAATGSTFAGWGGACSGAGSCSVTMDAAKSVTATFNLSSPPSSFALTVTKAGNGGGLVVSTSPPSPSINCGAMCSASYPSGTVVTLAAGAATGSSFAGWSGACGGVGTCTVTMDAAKSVTAAFTLVSCGRECPPPSSFTLTVSKTGSGSGTVVSTSPPSPSITCGATCAASYPSGTMVTLAATASADSTFAGWSGACGGVGSCTVTMDAAKSVTATFNLTNPPASFTLTVTKNGQGTVVSTSPPSPVITCGATCAASYPSGTVVTLAATPSAGWVFTGWSGACTGTGSCSVTMDAAKSVTATFIQGRS